MEPLRTQNFKIPGLGCKRSQEGLKENWASENIENGVFTRADRS